MMLHLRTNVLLKKVKNHNGSTFYIPHNWEGSLNKAPKFSHGTPWTTPSYRKATAEEIEKYKDNVYFSAKCKQ